MAAQADVQVLEQGDIFFFYRPRVGAEEGRRCEARALGGGHLQLLAGIDFPKNRAGIVSYARQHGDRIDNPDEAIEVLSQLPDRRYETMVDVAAGLGKVR